MSNLEELLSLRTKCSLHAPQGTDIGHVIPAVMSSQGFHTRSSPDPSELTEATTPDSKLFHTTHMGFPVVDPQAYRLIIDGLVRYPLCLSLSDLHSLPISTMTTFHEGYSNYDHTPAFPVHRIGSVHWGGIPLRLLLYIAQPVATFLDTTYVWSTGLDHGKFFDAVSRYYEKDLPLWKAVERSTFIAWWMNGEPLTRERGFPVRLIVPGWYANNSTKWLSGLSVQASSAPGPWTTSIHKELDPTDATGRKWRPIRAADVNSMICWPKSEARLAAGLIKVRGYAWGNNEVTAVRVVAAQVNMTAESQGENNEVQSPQCTFASVNVRHWFKWQSWEAFIHLTNPATLSDDVGYDGAQNSGKPRIVKYRIAVRAMDSNGHEQPLTGRRNCVHSIEVYVVPEEWC